MSKLFSISYIVFYCVVKDLLICTNRISVWFLLERCHKQCHTNIFWNVLSFCQSLHILHPELTRCSSVPTASILFEYLRLLLVYHLFAFHCHFAGIVYSLLCNATTASSLSMDFLEGSRGVYRSIRVWKRGFVFLLVLTSNIFTYIFQDWPKL